MAVYLYAICHTNAAVPDARGLDGAQLRMVRADRLAALVCDCTATSRATNEEELWEHERVVEALMEFHDLLPARFGSVLASDEAVAELLSARAQELQATLDYIAGAAELGVRIAHPPVQSPGASRGSGHEYFAERLRVRERVGSLVTRVEHSLSPLARASRIRIPTSADAAVAGAFLVARERVAEFAHRVDALDLEIAGARVFCTGPWPVYSFSDVGAVTR